MNSTIWTLNNQVKWSFENNSYASAQKNLDVMARWGSLYSNGWLILSSKGLKINGSTRWRSFQWRFPGRDETRRKTCNVCWLQNPSGFYSVRHLLQKRPREKERKKERKRTKEDAGIKMNHLKIKQNTAYYLRRYKVLVENQNNMPGHSTWWRVVWNTFSFFL